jgi:hypothetical protein
MSRRVALGVATLVAFCSLHPAACASARAAGPFPEQVIEPAPAPSHTWAYVALTGGVGLIGLSFVLADKGNDTYAEYEAETDPARIDALYDRTERYDRLASASLIGGELLVATGLYLRFLRRPTPMRVAIGPTRCAIALRF